jgi:hypothetical protein
MTLLYSVIFLWGTILLLSYIDKSPMKNEQTPHIKSLLTNHHSETHIFDIFAKVYSPL